MQPNPTPITPDDKRLNPPDIGRPTAEMLLSLPAFVTGEILFGDPEPVMYWSDGKVVHMNKEPAK